MFGPGPAYDSLPSSIFDTVGEYGVLMSVAVVLTGNHWVIDGFVGIALAMIGLYVAHRLGWLTRRWHEPTDTEDADATEQPKLAKAGQVETSQQVLAEVGPAGIEPATERL